LVYLEGQRSPATASELLRETAEVAEGNEVLIGEGTYLYAKVKVEQLTISGERGEAWSVVLPIEEETWVAADGAGRIRSVIGEPRFLGPRDRERWRAAGSPPFASGVSDDEFPAGTLVYEDLSSLPTVPDRLLAVLQDQVVSEDLPSDVAVFVRVGELLASADATPELRAALYRVAAGLPGIELDGATADPSGRPGVAVAMTYTQRGAAVRASMIFDAETSALLARVEVLLERATWVDAEPGTPFFSMTYLAGGRTNSLEVPLAGSPG
jgi:hypothetical protein